MMWVGIAGIAANVGMGIYGNQQAKKSADKLKKQQQPLIDQQLAASKMLQPYGQGMMSQGKGNMDMVQQYLQRMASGDRNLMQQSLAPEINGMTQAAQGSVANARSLYPRSGGSAAAAAQLPYQLQGGINNLMFGARPQAMQQLAQLGGNQSSLGLSAMGQGSGLTNNMLQYGLQAQNQMFNQGSQIGQGMSSMVTPMLQWYMMNRQGNTNPQIPTQSYKTTPDSMWGNTSVPTSHTSSGSAPWGMGNANFGWGTNPSYGNYSPSNNPYGGGK